MAVFSREEHAANFIKKATDKFGDKFDYSKVDYVNNCTPVLIECPDHGIYSQKPIDHVSSKFGCPKCALEHNGKVCRSSQADVIDKFNLAHGVGTYDYSKVNYVGMDKKVEIICPVHGSFFQTPSGHASGKKCKKCASDEFGKTRRLTQDQAIANFVSVHGEGTYNYDEVVYTTSQKKVKIICPTHGPFYQKPSDHMKGGCAKCGVESAKAKRVGTQDEMIARFVEKFEDRYDYSKVNYISGKSDKVEIICPVHGSFFQSPLQHLASDGCPKCTREKQGLRHRCTQEEVIEAFNNKHGIGTYNYDEVEYTTANTKVTIICPTHGPFLQTPNAHRGGAGCDACGVDRTADACRRTHEDVLAEFNTVHGVGTYDYSKFTSYTKIVDKIEIICHKHGSFHQTSSAHLAGSGCPKCKGDKISEVTKDTPEKVLADFNEVHGDKYDYSKMVYVNSQTKVEIICDNPEHGSFWLTPSKHKNGRGCQKCSAYQQKHNNPNKGKKRGPSPRRLSTQEFIDRSNIVHSNRYDYSLTVYTGSNQLVTIICPVHGEFEQRAGKHMLSGHGCQVCAQVKQTSKIGNSWIATLGETVIPEYQLADVRFRKVDGYDPVSNTVYQFHGDFFHGNPNHPKLLPDKMNTMLKKTYGELYANTQRLDQEIRDAGYNLVIMWELDWRRISNQPKK